MKTVPDFDTLGLPANLCREQRSNHAGETGAVSFYRGVLAVAINPAVRSFAAEHVRAERRHLAFFDSWLPAGQRSRLLPLWRAAGWTLGAVSAAFGARAVYATVRAVESFVERHYRAQIEALGANPAWAPLRARLQDFCNEEVAHRDDAAGRLQRPPGRIGRAWATVVGAGSAAGAAAARRF